jgi:uncharacterized protein YjbI with pentapeptide repeats
VVGRLLRVTGTVLVIAVAFITPALATSAPASADTVVNGCTIVANPSATNFTNCPGANLSGTDLSGDNLTFANLAGANLSNSSLVGCVLLSYSQGECQSANLSDANLTGANLSNDLLVNCALLPPFRVLACGAVQMPGANLSDANLSNSPNSPVFYFLASACASFGCQPDFNDAVLTGANLTGTPLIPFLLSPVTATSIAGAVVTYSPVLSASGAFLDSCTPPSGSTFAVGTTTVTCQVLDDFGDVATGTFPVVVSQVETIADVVSSSPNPSPLGKSVTYTAFVFSQPDPSAPTPAGGTVAFLDNDAPISGCSAVPISATSKPSTATAACTSTPDTTGAHAITARYSGSGIFAPGSSAGPLAQVVTQHPCQTLAGCNLKGLDLSQASLTKADFQGANLMGADLRGAILDYANLMAANLNGADLGGADLIRATLEGASLKGANLKGVLWGSTICPDGTNSNNHGGTCVGHL